MTTTVQETLVDTGVQLTDLVVSVFLAGDDGLPLAAGYVDDQAIVTRYSLTPDTDGLWTVDLPDNASIIPAGTAWGVQVNGNRVDQTVRFIDVPAGPGPVEVQDILTDPPGDIDPSTYALLDARVTELEEAPAGGVPDGDKGDITVSASGTTWTIDANVVTLAKIVDIATASLLGRTTAGTGDPEVLSTSTVRTLLSVYTQAQVDTAISTAIATLVGTAPGALDTLGEISDALNDDANLYATLVAAIAASVSDAAYNEGTWNGVTTVAPSKNAVRDAIEALSGTYVGLTGDQTVAGIKTFSSTPVVPDASWTLAKVANIATARLLGRSTAGSGVIEELSASTARTLLSLVPGTDVQAYSSVLALVAGLTPAADRLPYFTGAGSAALATFTAAGRALVDDADAAAQRTTLGLGTMATATATDYVAKTLFDANTLLTADTDDTPAALTVAASRIVGRKASGGIAAMTTAELAALFGTPTGSKFLADDGTLKTAGGAVATDVIWDSPGDLARGTGADTASRLAIGSAYQNLRVNSGATDLEWATTQLPPTTARHMLLSPSLIYGNINVTPASAGANVAEYTPFIVYQPVTINRVLIYVGTSSGNIDVGIYDSTGTGGGPGARIASSGSTACPTGTAAAAVTVAPGILAPGMYYAALAASNGTSTFRFVSDSQISQGLGVNRYNQASAFPLPSAATPSAASNASVFMIVPGVV